mgnify:CR=1 FL=1
MSSAPVLTARAEPASRLSQQHRLPMGVGALLPHGTSAAVRPRQAGLRCERGARALLRWRSRLARKNAAIESRRCRELARRPARQDSDRSARRQDRLQPASHRAAVRRRRAKTERPASYESSLPGRSTHDHFSGCNVTAIGSRRDVHQCEAAPANTPAKLACPPALVVLRSQSGSSSSVGLRSLQERVEFLAHEAN